MLNSFEQMPEESRLWIYQANRSFKKAEKEHLESALNAFVETWAAHGKPLKAAYKILRDQFVLLAVDESHHMASGCSIDDSVDLIKQVENNLGLQLLDRSNVAFLVNDQVEVYPLKEIKSKIQAGEIGRDTAIFNNFVDRLKDYKSTWLQPAGKSWVGRYFE